MDDGNANTRLPRPSRRRPCPFFGQFVDHDVTLDVVAVQPRCRQRPPDRNPQCPHPPTLDLDCIYGPGPEAAPYLYHQGGDFQGAKLITGADFSASAMPPDDLMRIGQLAW